MALAWYCMGYENIGFSRRRWRKHSKKGGTSMNRLLYCCCNYDSLASCIAYRVMILSPHQGRIATTGIWTLVEIKTKIHAMPPRYRHSNTNLPDDTRENSHAHQPCRALRGRLIADRVHWCSYAATQKPKRKTKNKRSV